MCHVLFHETLCNANLIEYIYDPPPTDTKKTNNLDGSKVVPFSKVRKEVFHPERAENISTTETVKKIAVEVALCLLAELRTKKKATHKMLSSEDGEWSWGNVSEEEHQACIGKMA